MATSPSVRRGESIDRLLAPGILAGMVAALAMGLFTMTAAVTWQHRAASAPLRDVAAIADPRFAETPAQRAASSEPFDAPREPQVFAGALHLLLGGLFGAVFGLLARAARLRGLAAVAAGLLFGLAVMVFSAALLLPATAAVSGTGTAISGLPGRLGWPTFAAAHAVFGLVLGLWVLLRPWDVARELSG